jgi:hypothetical protein
MSAALKKWADQVFGAVVLPEPSEAETFARIDRIDETCPPDRTTILRLIEVFEHAGSVLAPYSDESLDRGFWDLGGCALGALRDEEIEWPLRRRLIRSFEILFREIFAVRCQPVLGHRSEEGSPLNSACYMWWDFDALGRERLSLAQKQMHPVSGNDSRMYAVDLEDRPHRLPGECSPRLGAFSLG